MYAKLFSRITESSILEESVTTRWVFVALLAIAELDGTVIGTDIAIARRINVPLKDFEESMKVLMAPDPNSNNMDFGGARIILSSGERGYFLTGYARYRSLKTEDERRQYMKEYMAKKRANVNSVNFPLAKLTHTEPESQSDSEPLRESISGLDDIVKTWNSMCVLPKVMVLTDKRKKAIKSRMADEFFSSNWKQALEKIKNSAFCLGRNERGWKATFDWFLRPDSVAKAMEGTYDDKDILKPKISDDGFEMSSHSSFGGGK